MKFENVRVFNFEGALRGMRNPKNSWHLSDSQYGIASSVDDFNNKVYAMALEHLKNLHPEEAKNDDLSMFHKEYIDLCNFYGEHGVIAAYEKATNYAFIGPKDMRLAQTLIKAGPEHRKFLRQIFVCVDITAPLYWWKEFDTYKVGTVANSTSTMHKIMSQPITLDSFEIDDMPKDLCFHVDGQEVPCGPQRELIVKYCESLRQEYCNVVDCLKTKDDLDANLKETLNKQKDLIWKELIRWVPESWLQTRTVTLNYENLLAICSKSQRRFHKLNEWSGKDDNSLNNFIRFARTLPYAPQFIFIDEENT